MEQDSQDLFTAPNLAYVMSISKWRLLFALFDNSIAMLLSPSKNNRLSGNPAKQILQWKQTNGETKYSNVLMSQTVNQVRNWDVDSSKPSDCMILRSFVCGSTARYWLYLTSYNNEYISVKSFLHILTQKTCKSENDLNFFLIW